MLKKIKENRTIIIILLIVVALIFIYPYTKKTTKKTVIGTDSNVKIKANEVSKITLEDYKTDIFSMKKPKGWTIESGGSGIYYAIKVSDPNDSNNGIFLMLKIQPLLKSNEAKKQWNDYYNLTGKTQQYKLFADAVVLDNPTTEGFYQKFNEIGNYIKTIEPTFASFNFPVYKDFKKEEEMESNASMKSYALDSKVLRATFTGENDKKGEGLFLSSIVNFGGQSTNGVDLSYYMVYDIMTITSSEAKLIDYKDLLLESINSIEFSDSYVQKTIDDSNAQTQQALKINAEIQAAFDSYMSAWGNRQKSYDIMSQKQSDATLGYERVYNVDTGEIYKAYNGFTDDYDGKQYKSITDEMYAEKTSGYIEK